MNPPNRSLAASFILCSALVSAGAFAQEETPPATDVPTAEKQTASPTLEPQQTPAPSESKNPVGVSGFEKGKGFRLLSPDKNWSLRVGLQAAYRVQTLHEEGEGYQPTGQFYVVRPRIDGSIYKDWIRFWTSFEFASNPPFLLDSYIEVQPIKQFAVRFGQFWSPISWHEQLGPQELVFPDWAYVAEYYWPGRDKGIAFFGTSEDGKFAYQAQLTGGTGLRTFQTVPGNWLAQAAARFYPLGPLEHTTEFAYMQTDSGKLPTRVGFSVSGWAGKLEANEASFNPRRGQLTFVPTGAGNRQQGGEADFIVQTGRVIVYGEGYVKRTDPFGNGSSDASTSIGAWGQVSAAVYKKWIDVALQGGWIDPDTRSEATGDAFVYGEAKVGFYILAPYLFIHLRYGLAHQDTPAIPEPSLAGPPGWSNIFTLQWNVYF